MPFRIALRNCLATLIIVSGLISQTDAKPKPAPVKSKPAAAKPKPAGVGHPIVDVVSLKSGRTLRGAVAWQDPNGSLKMAVSTDWFRESNPTQIATTLTENIDQRRIAWAQASQRISERLKTAAESPRLTFFLKQESERIQGLLADRNLAEPDFLWIEVPQASIAKIARASLEQRNVALFAWNEKLTHVESRDIASLTKELTDNGVAMNGPAPDLTERLPPRSQDEGEWAARMALVEYGLTTAVNFQGFGDAVIRAGEGQPIDFAEVLPKLFQQQLSSLLKDLSADNRPGVKPPESTEWLNRAIHEAEAAPSRGFRITRLDVDAASTRVTVESRFVAQLGLANWQTVWQTVNTEDGTLARPAVEKQIEQDPQVKSISKLIKSIGVVDPDAMQRAIRFGAATMAAQQSADALFSEFRDRYTRRLDGPPLPLMGQ